MFGAATGSLDVLINGVSAPGFPIVGQQQVNQGDPTLLLMSI